MTEPSDAPVENQPADDVRQHAESSAEGSDAAQDAAQEVPREHSEDPAEG